MSGFVGGGDQGDPLVAVGQRAQAGDLSPRADEERLVEVQPGGGDEAVEIVRVPVLPEHGVDVIAADRAFLLDPADAELFLSPHTIKSQMRSIYRKRGTSSRSQAVARARELRLLEGKTLCSCGAYGPSQTWRARLNDGDL